MNHPPNERIVGKKVCPCSGVTDHIIVVVSKGYSHGAAADYTVVIVLNDRVYFGLSGACPGECTPA